MTRKDPRQRRRHHNGLPEPTGVRLVLGLMSGTSCDGVDAVLVAIRGCGLAMRVRPLAHRYEPYPPPLRARLLRVMCPARTSTQE
ncbi:MAG: anhydro-N-acetylmuramic acid kinase, partial [Phycisphaerae bacterium]